MVNIFVYAFGGRIPLSSLWRVDFFCVGAWPRICNGVHCEGRGALAGPFAKQYVEYGGGAVASGNEIDSPLSGGNGAFPSTTVSSYTEFDYYADYHVAAIWSGLNAGLFGAGLWKEGSVPFNPHWKELTTPTGTDNGTLQGVTIKASAQQD